MTSGYSSFSWARHSSLRSCLPVSFLLAFVPSLEQPCPLSLPYPQAYTPP